MSLAMKSQPAWYQSISVEPCADPAKAAFDKARLIFGASSSVDDHDAISLSSAQHIDSILHIINRSKKAYDDGLKNKSPRKWLFEFSRRIVFYSKIFDAFVQHHPEYVALAWGAFKTLFLCFENHDKKIQTLAKALTEIAEALPRAELASRLYPTKRMEQVVSELYAHVLNFCVRAKRWYEASPLKHVLQSLTHPIELEYTDIISDIKSSSQNIRFQAEAAGQAEQRDVHLLLQRIDEKQQFSNDAIQRLQQTVQECQRIIATGQIQTCRSLQDLQVSLILSYVATTSQFDELKTLQACLHANVTQAKRYRKVFNVPICALPKVQAWNETKTSSLLIVGADRKAIQEPQSFCTSIIKYLRDREVPVIWVMPAPLQSDTGNRQLSSLEIFKSMAAQALRLNQRMQVNSKLNVTCQDFQKAETEDEWITILATIMCNMPRSYLIIDLNMVDTSLEPLGKHFTWTTALAKLFRELSSQGSTTIVKVVLVRVGTRHTREERSASANFCVSLGGSGRSTAVVRRDIPFRLTKGFGRGKQLKLSVV